jgi:hypothetical protein
LEIKVGLGTGLLNPPARLLGQKVYYIFSQSGIMN